MQDNRFQVQGSSLPWPPARSIRLVAYASESATGCGYEIVFRFYKFGIPSPHLEMPGLGQGFRGYKMLISVTLYSIVPSFQL
jgi:hypothetical protein